MENSDDSSHVGRTALIAIVVLVALAVSAYSLIGLKNERGRAEDLASTNQALRDSLARMQDQLQSVSTRLESLAQPPAPARTAEPSARVVAPKAPKVRAKSSAP